MLARAATAALAFAVTLAAAATATAAPLVLPIPGLIAGQLRVAGISRLTDGSALIAASVDPARHGGRWSQVAVRLLLDGSVDLGYANQGIATPAAGSGHSATALAINPASGQAWIGLAGPGGRSEILALGPTGAPDRGFGRGGVVTLAAGQAPVALAWAQRMLFVASGTAPCGGCRLSVLNPATGATLAGGSLAPAVDTPGGSCAHGSVSSAVSLGPSAAQLAFSGGAGCPPQLVTVAIADSQSSVTTAKATPLGLPGRSTLEAQYGSADCVATETPSATEFGPVVPAPAPFSPWHAPGGRLNALVALGQGACAALISSAHGAGGIVVQASPQQPRPASDRVPSSIAALGMFRCHAHLLVIGARAQAHELAGVVVVLPVRRGPNAQVAIAASRSRRCS